MDKELKRELKADEFASVIDHALVWLNAHKDEARITAVVLAVVAAVLGGVVYFQGVRRREVARDFAEALKTFDAPVASAPSPEREVPAGRIFPTAKEKYTQAVGAFDGLTRKAPASAEGERARYFAALSRIEIGQVGEAERALSELAARREAGLLEPALARLALAELYRRNGQTDKAAELFRQLATDSASVLPRDYALLRLAVMLEDAKKLAESRAAYERLSDEFPRSVYAPEARRRADQLKSVVEG